MILFSASFHSSFWLLVYYDTTDYLQVMLIQEQLSKNRIIIDMDKKGKWVVLFAFCMT